MKRALRKIGNSQGVILPKAILAQLGVTDEVELELEQDAIILRKPLREPRRGWAQASAAIATAGDDALVWPEFANNDDSLLEW